MFDKRVVAFADKRIDFLKALVWIGAILPR
jgi:hypothetical protein